MSDWATRTRCWGLQPIAFAFVLTSDSCCCLLDTQSFKRREGFKWTFLLLSIVMLVGNCAQRSVALDQGEIEALEAMMESFPSNPMGWNTSVSEACSGQFSGIVCDPETHHIVSIDFSQMPLSGTLPPEIVGFHWIKAFNCAVSSLFGELPDVFDHWTSIEEVQLQANSLEGLLPSSLCQPTLKRLEVTKNYFNGSIPDCFGSLPSLAYFNVAGNLLSGSLPATFGTSQSLNQLDINYNRIEGKLLPFFESPMLQYLSLSGNLLSGTLPASWANLKAITLLSLSFNAINGSIPTEWGNMKTIQSLDMTSNLLEGTLPSSLGDLPALSFLDISENSITGTIPSSLGKLESAKSLRLSGNDLSGTIPEEFASLKGLQELMLAGNELSGTIPAGLNNLTSLRTMCLSNNRLTGEIPPLDALTSMDELRLDGNILDGRFPVLPTSKSLLLVNLAGNLLKGVLPPVSPSSFIPSWVKLNVSDNFFTGPFPPSYAFMRGLREIDAANNFLTGTLPWTVLTGGSLKVLRLSGNRLTGHLPRLSNIEILDVSRNKFEFPIGSLSARMWQIKSLNLSQNHIGGSMEGLFQILATARTVDLSGNDLSGPVPWREIRARFASGVLNYLAIDNNPKLERKSGYYQAGLRLVNPPLTRSIAGNLTCYLLSFPSPSPSTFLYDELLFEFTECFCDPGTWGMPGTACLACPPAARGLRCPGGPFVEVDHNFYPYIVGDPKTGQVETERCLYDPDWIPSSWNPCLSKAYVTRERILVGKICTNSTGRRCSQCTCPLDTDEPCFFHKNMRCIQCAEGAEKTLLGALIPASLIAFGVAIGAFTYILSSYAKMKKFSIWKLRLKLAASHGLLKILVSFIQFSLELIHWDIALSVGVLGVVNSDPSGIGLECAFRKLASPSASFLLKTLLPFAVVLGLWCLIGLAWLLSRYIINMRTNNESEEVHDKDENFESDLDFDHSHLAPDSKGDLTRSARSASSLGTSATLSVVSLFYFGFSISVISVFIPEKQPGTSKYFMLSHPFLEWSDPSLSPLRILGGILLIFVVAIPFLKIALLVIFRHKMQEEKVFSYISSLYRPFKANRYWWDLVLTARKFCIAAVLASIDSESPFKPWAVTLTITIFSVLQAYFNPWKRDIENHFENISSAVLIISYLSTWNHGLEGSGSRQLVMVGRIFAICFVVALVIVWMVSVLLEQVSASNGGVTSDIRGQYLALRGESSEGALSTFAPSDPDQYASLRLKSIQECNCNSSNTQEEDQFGSETIS